MTRRRNSRNVNGGVLGALGAPGLISNNNGNSSNKFGSNNSRSLIGKDNNRTGPMVDGTIGTGVTAGGINHGEVGIKDGTATGGIVLMEATGVTEDGGARNKSKEVLQSKQVKVEMSRLKAKVVETERSKHEADEEEHGLFNKLLYLPRLRVLFKSSK
jgi:hypothetical protein